MADSGIGSCSGSGSGLGGKRRIQPSLGPCPSSWGQMREGEGEKENEGDRGRERGGEEGEGRMGRKEKGVVERRK